MLTLERTKNDLIFGPKIQRKSFGTSERKKNWKKKENSRIFR